MCIFGVYTPIALTLSLSSQVPALAFLLQDATSTIDLKADSRVPKTFQATP